MKTSVGHKLEQLRFAIRNTREARGYSQEYIANRLFLSQNAYSKMEIGTSGLSVERLLLICEILEVSVFDLLDFDTAKGNSSLFMHMELM